MGGGGGGKSTLHLKHKLKHVNQPGLRVKNPPSNQSMAALAEGGSSKETVASPFSFPVSLSVYRLIMGSPVFLLT